MADRYASGREYFEWIELHQSFCANAFGDGVASSAASGACMATLSASGDEKCHNTLSTCARVDNYVESSLVLRFCRDGVRLPRDGEYYFPLLASARILPASINPGVGNRDKGALGTRAQLDATFRDGPHSDVLVDPYLAERLIGAAQYDGVGYNPFTRSTFWRKWAARNLYKLNRRVVHCGGYIDADGTVGDVVRREFWVSGFTGPNTDGSVTIQGLDILARIADEKAQIPAPSTGKLDAGITNASGSATLTPTGVGDDEYPAAGFACIGDEIVEFTRSGDVLTLTTRGDWGTTADGHDAGATVQLCEHFDSVTPSEILQRALAAAAIDPSEYCDLLQWADETYTFLPRLYTTLIPRPVGAYQLVGEVGEQMFLYIFLDDRDGLIKLRAVRPAADETITALDENGLLSLTSREQPDQRLSRVVVNYAMRDYSKPVDEATNYTVTDIVGAFEEENPERSGGPMTRVINSRWLDATDGAAAVELGERLLARYKVPPRRVSFALDAKDRDLWVGDFVSITTAQHVDRFGVPVPIPVQVLSVTEDVPGHRFSYDAQQFVFEAAEGNVRTVDISGNVTDINLRDLYFDKFGNLPDYIEEVRFTVRSGASIGATSTSVPAIDVDAWPEPVLLRLVNHGTIAGYGGAGGNAAASYAVVDQTAAGSPGGTAIKTTRAITIDNPDGIIGGGGGGGGGGGISYLGAPAVVTSGGGGAGISPGVAGIPSKGNSAANEFTGSAGSTYTGGAGGYFAISNAGGDLGDPGLPLTANPYVGGSDQYWKAGGASGAAIDGIVYVTFLEAGDIRGPQV